MYSDKNKIKKDNPKQKTRIAKQQNTKFDNPVKKYRA
jgi:hypothetical protein